MPQAKNKKTGEACFACRPESEGGLGLVFEHLPDGTVRARWTPGRIYQSYDGVLHGGIIALLLDAAMMHCMLKQGGQCLTGRLSVRYLKKVPIETTVTVEARLTGKKRGLYMMEAALKKGKTVAAKAEGRLMYCVG